jgi:hypothetical protein
LQLAAITKVALSNYNQELEHGENDHWTPPLFRSDARGAGNLLLICRRNIVKLPQPAPKKPTNDQGGWRVQGGGRRPEPAIPEPAIPEPAIPEPAIPEPAISA